MVQMSYEDKHGITISVLWKTSFFKLASLVLYTYVFNFVNPIIIYDLKIQPVNCSQKTGRLGQRDSNHAAIETGGDSNIRPCRSTMLLTFSRPRV